MGQADFATVNGGSIGALPAASYTPDAWASGNNTDVTLASNTVAGNTNSLRFNTASGSANPVSLALSGAATIDSGGILVTQNVGASGAAITGGTLEGAAGQGLVIHQYDTAGGLTIGANIVNNTSATALTKSGPGLVTLTGTNSYTGTTYVNAGTLQGGVAALPTSVVVARGATLAIDSGSSQATFNPSISGQGGLTKVGSGTLTISGAAINTFTGPTLVQQGTFQLSPVSLPLSAFSPGSLSAWYSASSLTSANLNGTTVQTWNDLSGNGHTATYTGGNAPTLLSNQFGSLPAVNFNNTNMNVAGNMTVGQEFVVFKSANGAGTTFGPDWGTPLGTQGDGNEFMLQPGSTQFWNDGNRIPQAVWQNGVAMSSGNQFAMSNVGQYFVMEVNCNANDIYSNAFKLGGNAGWNNIDMDVAEILAFSSPLSASQANVVGGYLSAKYGIAGTYRNVLGFPSTSAVTVAGSATFDLNNNAQAIASLAGAGNVLLGTGSLDHRRRQHLDPLLGRHLRQRQPDQERQRHDDPQRAQHPDRHDHRQRRGHPAQHGQHAGHQTRRWSSTPPRACSSVPRSPSPT